MPTRADRGARRRAGITLFETVVAMTIVGLTAVSAMTAVGAELRAAERARRALEAEALATQRALQLDLLTDAELTFLPDSVAEGRFDAPLDGYRWSTAARPFETEPGVYDVTVRVTWADGAYALRTRAFRRPVLLAR